MTSLKENFKLLINKQMILIKLSLWLPMVVIYQPTNRGHCECMNRSMC